MVPLAMTMNISGTFKVKEHFYVLKSPSAPGVIMVELLVVAEAVKVTLFLKGIRHIFIIINILPQFGRMPLRFLRDLSLTHD